MKMKTGRLEAEIIIIIPPFTGQDEGEGLG